MDLSNHFLSNHTQTQALQLVDSSPSTMSPHPIFDIHRSDLGAVKQHVLADRWCWRSETTKCARPSCLPLSGANLPLRTGSSSTGASTIWTHMISMVKLHCIIERSKATKHRTPKPPSSQPFVFYFPFYSKHHHLHMHQSCTNPHFPPSLPLIYSYSAHSPKDVDHRRARAQDDGDGAQAEDQVACELVGRVALAVANLIVEVGRVDLFMRIKHHHL